MADFASSNRYPKRTPSKPGRVALVREEFDNLIEDQGVRVRITPSILCPNRTDVEGTNHKLNCPVCGGDEAVDIPGAAVEDWAFIQAIKLDKEFQVQGVWDMKDAMVSTKSDTRLYYFYKLEVLDFASIFNQVVKRGSGADKLRYYPATVTTDTPYYLIDSAGVTYTKDKHYKIVDQTIEWKVAGPTVDTLYSFVYPVLPTYRVLELLHENRYYYVDSKRPDKAPIQMPQQAVIRWDFLARNQGANERLET